MFKKIIAASFILSTLSACGGGGSGGGSVSSGPSNPAPTVLKTFGDGAGIARAEITANGQTVTANVMAGDINNYNTDPTGVIDPSGISFSGSNQYGNFYSGRTTLNGITVDVVYYEDSGGDTFIGYLEGNGTNAALAGGYKASNMPSGVYNYAGTNIIGFRDGSYFEEGTFAMAVDFTNGTAGLTGSTATSTISGQGIQVNTSNGTFSGNNLTLSGNGVSTSASIYGNFHGSGATGVTGLYADNGNTPIVAGAIAGRR